MRVVNADQIRDTVEELFLKASFELADDVLSAIERAKGTEVSPAALDILNQIEQNADIAREQRLPLCQDCGIAVVFVDIGQEVAVEGGSLREAINEGVRRAYDKGYLRKSILGDPFERVNTGDNTPAFIHFDIVPGDKIRLRAMPKGGGCENMSFLSMMKPADGLVGVKKFVVECASKSGANPCPPTTLGVGVGGNFEIAPLLAKKSLLREIGTPNPDPKLDEIERELLEAVNDLGIGPQGLGGKNTCLAVHIITAPCHLASLPVAVNTECHSHRHKEATI
jgi:fumarate hydratase subunit alpha